MVQCVCNCCTISMQNCSAQSREGGGIKGRTAHKKWITLMLNFFSFTFDTQKTKNENRSSFDQKTLCWSIAGAEIAIIAISTEYHLLMNIKSIQRHQFCSFAALLFTTTVLNSERVVKEWPKLISFSELKHR